MYENLFKNPLHRVFVYGTLKRGEPNHRLLQSTKDGYAKFLGCGKSVEKYPLVIATRYNIPFLLKKPGTGNEIPEDAKFSTTMSKFFINVNYIKHGEEVYRNVLTDVNAQQILGEIYDVDTMMLEKLDKLEEHPSFYVRTEEDVLMALATISKPDVNFEEIGVLVKAWTYFLPKFNAALLEKTMLVSYTNEGSHGLKYAERYLRDPDFNHRREVQ